MPEPLVLVVDDQAYVVRTAQRILESAGFRVLSTTVPAQALIILERYPVEVMLVDIRMPGLDGLHLLSLARDLHPELTVVTMTGYGTVDTAIAALQHGADSLLLKPFTATELVENVRQAIQDSQQKRDAVRLQALKPLFSVMEVLFSEIAPEKLKEQIILTICDYLKCSYAGLYDYSEDADAWEMVRCRGDWLPERIRSDSTDPWRTLLNDGKAVFLTADHIESAGAEPGAGDNEQANLPELLEQYRLSSIIAVSVSHKESNSMLIAARSSEAYPFRPADLEMALILARQTAAALDNAQLYNQQTEAFAQYQRSQAALIVAEKMAVSSRLGATIAHEMNNPLQALDNLLELAGRKKLQVEQRDHYLQQAREELERLINNVQRLLAIFRPEARDRRLTDINQLIQQTLRFMQPHFDRSGIQVHTQLANPLPLITIVGGQIQEVLINLLMNAVEAMPEGGEIFLETAAYYTPGGGPPPQKAKKNLRPYGVEIIVGDSGPGIPEAEQKHIFEPFRSTKENGTGLGLAVSESILTSHGGSITLINERYPGACFRILIPEGETYES